MACSRGIGAAAQNLPPSQLFVPPKKMMLNMRAILGPQYIELEHHRHSQRCRCLFPDERPMIGTREGSVVASLGLRLCEVTGRWRGSRSWPAQDPGIEDAHGGRRALTTRGGTASTAARGPIYSSRFEVGSSVSGKEGGSRDWRSVAKKVRSAVESEEERRLPDVDGGQV